MSKHASVFFSSLPGLFSNAPKRKAALKATLITSATTIMTEQMFRHNLLGFVEPIVKIQGVLKEMLIFWNTGNE